MRVGTAGDWVARKVREGEGGVAGGVVAFLGLSGGIGRRWGGFVSRGGVNLGLIVWLVRCRFWWIMGGSVFSGLLFFRI